MEMQQLLQGFASFVRGVLIDPDVVYQSPDRARAEIVCANLTRAGVRSDLRKVLLLPLPGMPALDVFEVTVHQPDKPRALASIRQLGLS